MATAMLWVMLFVILLVNMVVAAQFESFFQPLAIMVAALLAFVAVPLALLMTGQSHSVMS
jgi:multidrug efflux pump subunit AcrB